MELNRDRLKIRVLDREALAAAAADHIARTCTVAVRERGRCLLALSGGRTPGPIYSLLASPSYDEAIPWRQVHLLWGDERAVPPEHEESNYRLVKESGLLERPLAGVHRLQGEIEPERAAEEYEGLLRRLAVDSEPSDDPVSAGDAGMVRLDLALNGMGDDGHTASLFPGSDALEEEERWVVATDVSRGFRRLSLTLPVFEAAGEVLFVIEGADKAEVLRAVLAGESDLPTARLLGRVPSATLLLDRKAASSLESGG